jgi:DDE superfamily endonuclease
MFVDSMPFITEYISELANELHQRFPKQHLSGTQKKWLSFCLSGMLLTGTLCWKVFERMGLGSYRFGALSWMFRNSKLPWDYLLQASFSLLMRIFNLKSGILVLDDTDHRRAKTTSRIFANQKIYDKKTGGYYNGQCLMFLLLVTDTVTLPIGMRFYRPDPKYKAWEKEDKRLKKTGIKAAQRPKAPEPDPNYPSKNEIALVLIDDFHRNHPDIAIKAVLADAAFGTRDFMETAKAKAGCKQVISQLRENQLVMFKNKWITVKDFFSKYGSVTQAVSVRGGKTNQMTVGSARLMVKAHGTKRFIIAVKNEDEAEYRYLMATDLTWRTLDILRCYTLRWLVEVFFADWKLYEGWAGMAKQPDEEGSFRGVTLSLLLDHALLIHPEQRACIENGTPAHTVGSLKRAAHGDALLAFVRKIALETEPLRMIEQLAEKIKVFFTLAPSKKHMSGRDLGRMEPSPSLAYRAVLT